MLEIYTKELSIARAQGSHAEALSYLSSIFRSLLQALALSSIEVTLQATPVADDDGTLKQFIDRFGQPSDGLPVEILDHLVPRIRSLVFRGFLKGWYEKNDGRENSIVEALTEWVEFRNKRPGHGVLDLPNTSLWAQRTSDLIQRVLDAAAEVLPQQHSLGLVAKFGDIAATLSVPLIVDGSAIVVSRVSSRGGVWKLQGQILSWSEARDVTLDLGPSTIFSTEYRPNDRFRWSEVPYGGASRLVLNNIPVRQTATFVGRKKELEKLAEWLESIADSRACLVFGDGGFGKTTLVLEFFNQLIDDGPHNPKTPLPSIISFYTAKRTKWTEEGLVHFKGISDAMEDSVRELMYCLHPVLGKDWYKLEGRALIEKAATDLTKDGFTRDDVLLIIDNTETLATSASDAEDLADFMSRVAKRVGRVVITSRRRELLAAEPVAVSQLSLEEALTLLRRLGAEYGAQSVVQASEPKLRKACEQLMYKPLLIDTLVRYIARSSTGIQEGLDQILKKTSDELLEFLYEDAWLRMNRLVQEVFIVLASLATPPDSKSVGDVCREVGVSHSEFQSSLAETYFATITDRGDLYDLEIVDLAKEFFRQKKRRANTQDAQRFDKIAFAVDKLAAARHEVDQAYRTDRVADAYRSEYAKAAKLAIIRRDYKAARENFDLAVIEEPLNAALRERIASFFLRNLGKAQLALPFARKATELDPQSADAWLTLGLVKFQVGDISGGDIAMDNAMNHGKPESLCALRKAIARYHAARLEPYGMRAAKLLKEAVSLVEFSLRLPTDRDFYSQKNRREAEKYVVLIRSLILMINRREVTADNSPQGGQTGLPSQS
ncbi:MAG: ATP-binding protein [Acidovorax sp.]